MIEVLDWMTVHPGATFLIWLMLVACCAALGHKG